MRRIGFLLLLLSVAAETAFSQCVLPVRVHVLGAGKMPIEGSELVKASFELQIRNDTEKKVIETRLLYTSEQQSVSKQNSEIIVLQQPVKPHKREQVAFATLATYPSHIHLRAELRFASVRFDDGSSWKLENHPECHDSSKPENLLLVGSKEALHTDAVIAR